jgi:putative transposase
MGASLSTELVTKALKQALYHRGVLVNKRLMHHLDRGCQYTSKEFRELAAAYGIELSMSAKGHCYDNAIAESFFHTLKTEETHLKRYRTREEGQSAIFKYIEVFYSRQRLHSTLGNVSPTDFEESWNEDYVLSV